jgi:hypothetical protein
LIERLKAGLERFHTAPASAADSQMSVRFRRAQTDQNIVKSFFR